MEYRSPLGCNFKLEQSLLNLSKSEANKDTPKKDETPLQKSSSSRNNSNNGKFPRGSRGSNYSFNNSSNVTRYSDSPASQRNSNNWNSPIARHSGAHENIPIFNYFHPSMLENPWEELEKNMKK